MNRAAGTPYICWQFLVMRHNEHEVEAAKKMAEELGVDRITIDHAYLPVMFREEALKWLPQNPGYHRYDRAELERKWQELEKAQGTGAASDIQEAAADTQELREEDIYAQDTFSQKSELLLALDAGNDKLGRKCSPLLRGIRSVTRFRQHHRNVLQEHMEQ